MVGRRQPALLRRAGARFRHDRSERTWDESTGHGQKRLDRRRSTAGSSAEDYDPADVQVWHSSDVDIIPRQEVQAKQDRRGNYLA